MARTSGIPAALVCFIAALSVATGQQIGTEIPEIHPELPTQFCTRKDGCVVRKTKIVADVMFRPMHVKDNVSMPCTAAFGTALCPDAATCTRNCVLEGVDYDSLGVATKGNALKLVSFVVMRPCSVPGEDMRKTDKSFFFIFFSCFAHDWTFGLLIEPIPLQRRRVQEGCAPRVSLG